MPQMAPLNWLTLFLYFLLILLLFNIMNYFNFTYSIKTKLIKKSQLMYNWKW